MVRQSWHGARLGGSNVMPIDLIVRQNVYLKVMLWYFLPITLPYG
jgi:hypothetical protein